jgi:hypothetical protein
MAEELLVEIESDPDDLTRCASSRLSVGLFEAGNQPNTAHRNIECDSRWLA